MPRDPTPHWCIPIERTRTSVTTLLANAAEPPGENGRERVPDVARSDQRDRVLVIIWSNPHPATADDRPPGATKLRVAEPTTRRRGGKHRRRRETCSCLAWTVFGSRRRFRRVIVLLAVAVIGVCTILGVLFGIGGDTLAHIASAVIALFAEAGSAGH